MKRFFLLSCVMLMIFQCNPIVSSAVQERKIKFEITDSRTIYKVGEEIQLKVKGVSASEMKKLKWYSSNKKVAVVSGGAVTVKRAGKCRIIVKNTKGVKAYFDFWAVNYTIPSSTEENVVTVSVQNASGKTYSYTIYNQDMKKYKKYREYLDNHGCAVSSLTAFLSSRVSECAKYTPEQVIEKVEKSVLPRYVVERNYSKRMSLQMPISMFGISTVLKNYNIRHKYVYSFSKERAENDLTNHLIKGKPAFIIVKRGKWAYSYHTMLLIGMTPSGKAIVADSANRKWAGKNQRIKYAKVSELVKYMWSSQRGNNAYWNGAAYNGGYILVD